MKIIKSKGEEIKFNYSKEISLTIDKKGVIVEDFVAEVVVERLGDNVSVENTLDTIAPKKEVVEETVSGETEEVAPELVEPTQEVVEKPKTKGKNK